MPGKRTAGAATQGINSATQGIRKKRKGKIVEDYSRDRAAYANKKTLALLLKPASPIPSNTGSARSFQRDTERGQKSCGTARFCCEVAHKYTDVRPGHRV